jgi:uncharacterized membrane protein
MTRLGRPWPLGLLASSVALSAAVAFDAHGPVRGVLALWFFLTCPGMAIVGLLDVEDALAEASLAVALSIAIGMLLALAMLVTHTWSPDAGAAVLVGLSVSGAALQVRIAHSARDGRRVTGGDRGAAGR